MGTVYKITNPVGAIYIGSTTRAINIRFKEYKSKSNTKTQIKLNNSFNKYGFENHIFEIVEVCELDNLRLREYELGILYNVLDRDLGLNLRLPKIGEKVALSEETKQKIRDSRKHIVFSEKTKLKMRNSRLKAIKNDSTLLLRSVKLKPILNESTNIIYSSWKEVQVELGISREYIAALAKGKYKSKKYKLKYV